MWNEVRWRLGSREWSSSWLQEGWVLCPPSHLVGGVFIFSFVNPPVLRFCIPLQCLLLQSNISGSFSALHLLWWCELRISREFENDTLHLMVWDSRCRQVDIFRCDLRDLCLNCLACKRMWPWIPQRQKETSCSFDLLCLFQFAVSCFIISILRLACICAVMYKALCV